MGTRGIRGVMVSSFDEDVCLVDVDGCTADLLDGLCPFLNDKTGKDVRPEDVVTYNFFKDNYGITDDELISEYVVEFINSGQYRPLPKAVECLDKIRKQRKVKFVSARDPRTKDATYQWLKSLGLVDSMDDIVFNGIRKKKYVKQHSSAVMVEDYLETANIVAGEGYRVFLIDMPYNQGESHPNVVRVKGWDEILSMLEGE